MGLNEYKKKRNFNATPEPPPSSKPEATGDRARFYIQDHHATRHHYDLRLEMEGVLKSWAVPKGFSFDPAVSRLAIEVEDHPIEYGSFEGTIPKGNYGAGVVKVWDQGTYTCRNGDPMIAKAEGHLTLIFYGKKLRGEFALVRTDGTHWLMIKKRDAYAHYGAGENAPTTKLFRPVKRRGPLGDVTQENGFVVEPWLTGTRAIAAWDGNDLRFYSRDLLPLHPKGPSLIGYFEGLPPCTLEGVLSKNHVFTPIDLLALDETSLEEKPLIERKRQLSQLLKRSKLKVGTFSESPSALNDIPWDPALVRSADSPYQPGIDPSASLVSHASLAKPLAKGKAKAPAFVLTHPLKPLWPKTPKTPAITKADLAAYFDAVAEDLLPFLQDRPLSLHRFPSGIKSKGFFQKNLIGFHPAFVRTLPVPSTERTVHYTICQNRETLQYLANLSCIELHPWLSHTPSLDTPDFVVLDLDPDGNDFSEICEVALAAKSLLESAGKTPRLKTSGADGLHIGIRCQPQDTGDTFDSARVWLLEIAGKLHKQFPKLTSLERKPALRRKKIYLDCFQNARGQTIVAPLSPRPREGAPVSIPLRWEELESKIRPTDFSIGSVPARIRDRRYSCGVLWDVGLRAIV